MKSSLLQLGSARLVWASLALTVLLIPAVRGSALAPVGGDLTIFTGLALDSAGEPAVGALVVSSHGGKTLTTSDGAYRLELDLAAGTPAVQLTAILGSGETAGTASASVDVPAGGGWVPVGTLHLMAGASCAASWLPTFGGVPGVAQGVLALAVFDDQSGSGPCLIVGGTFDVTGPGLTVNKIARWDGSTWSALGSGMDKGVHALAVHDDGSGPALYAGGQFMTAGGVPASRIARWDGATWSALGSGVDSIVEALVSHDDGQGGGPALYAAGFFGVAGGGVANRIAKWDGQGWSALGSAMSGPVNEVWALTEFDDGTGLALYAGGKFQSAGGVPASRIAKWDGAAWSALGSGLDRRVWALTTFDDGSGPALYAGGKFKQAGGVAAQSVARWDGTSWSALGLGPSSGVSSLGVSDRGTGPELFAGGFFDFAGGQEVENIARWDGSSWSPLPAGGGEVGTNQTVNALTEYDAGGGAGPELILGGNFSSAGTTEVNHLACWDGQTLDPLNGSIADNVLALAAFDAGLGSGPRLIAGGYLTLAGGVVANGVAEWDGGRWRNLGAGLQSNGGSNVQALLAHAGPGAQQPRLYAGGSFSQAGGQPASNIASWDGTAWQSLGQGLSFQVRALAAFDDGSGSGEQLFAGGWIGNGTQGHLERWDGVAWSSLGLGLDAPVYALAVHDDGGGAGQALFVGGGFLTAGGAAAPAIARWDGSSWSVVGSGLPARVRALAVFDDGSGPALYAGGDFLTVGGLAVNHLAKWNGVLWTPLGTGLDDVVDSLVVHDDGSGPALFVGGHFTTAGGVPASRLAKWDGATWSSLGSAMDNAVHALLSFDDGLGNGPALLAGGYFDQSAGNDRNLAKYGGCGGPVTYCTAGTSASGCQALLSASGVPSASAISGFHLIASTVEGSKDGLFFYGTNGRQANTWGSGTSFVCVIPPRVRGGLLTGSGTPGACDGAFSQDLNARWCATCPKPSHNPGAGAVMQAQLWYRDPQNTSNQTSSMSDAIEFVVQP